MSEKNYNFNFQATGIGSVPFVDIEATCRNIIRQLPSIPFWPQLVKRSYLEDMSIQYSEGLPLLEIVKEKRSLAISSSRDRETELVNFYDHFFDMDIDFFSISKDYAPGLYNLTDLFDKETTNYIKGQTVGPITFAASITDLNGKPVLHNPELLEAMASGIAIKALWQVNKLNETGKKSIIFLDEPYLSSFGSAFSSIQRHEVIKILQTVISYLRENADTLIGIHCCGNTDWSMIFESGPDIVNFDAYEYLNHFLLYPEDIMRFVEEGGTVAWGIIPTSDFSDNESVEGLFLKLQEGFNRLYEWGIDPEVLSERSILTPACGMGTMEPEKAEKALNLLSRLSDRCREKVKKIK